MTYVVGFNGPPHVGKDTIAMELAKYIGEVGFPIPVFFESFIKPCKNFGMELLGQRNSPENYARAKESCHAVFAGKNLREFMIDLSEKHLRLVYGRRFYANAMVNRCTAFRSPLPALVIVTDVGFEEEPAIMRETVGAENYKTVQLNRLDTDWSKDSRGYVDTNNAYVLDNNSTPRRAAQRLTDYLISNLGWEF